MYTACVCSAVCDVPGLHDQQGGETRCGQFPCASSGTDHEQVMANKL